MDKMGFVLMALGISMADSECLFIPIITTGLGCYMLWRGSRVK